jgi:hypothetical protein
LSLLNIIEKQNLEIIELRKEVQRLKNEINRLKGEQGQPVFKSKSPDVTQNKNISSENERKNTSERKTNRRKKRKDLPIHETKRIPLDKTGLPDDIEFKGYAKKIIQGIKFESYNTLVEREIFCSASTGKSFTAELPHNLSRSYSPELEAFIIELKFSSNMSEPKILELLQNRGFLISAGTISNIILNNGKDFANERDSIFESGLTVSKFTQTDSTGCVENGVQKQNHNFNSPFFSVFYTTDDRKRITILDLLRNSNQQILASNELHNTTNSEVSATRIFTLNEEFFSLLTKKGIAKANIDYLKQHATDALLQHDAIEKILSPFLERKNLYSQLYELAYIAGYHAEEGYPVVQILLTDDAPVYDHIALVHVLCWIHEGRHFKKLNPLVSEFRNALDDFLTQFWKFYHALLDFKKDPSPAYAILLEQKFDSLFTLATPYDALNERIKLVFNKKEELLAVLKYSLLPLHNNESELAARIIARQRDVSFQTKNKDGTTARDVLLSILTTAKKLNVNFYHYLVDRISRKADVLSLSDLILHSGAT